MRVSRRIAGDRSAVLWAVAVLAWSAPAPGFAQGPDRPELAAFAARSDGTEQEAGPEAADSWTLLGTAKWAGLAVGAGAAIYGFSLNSQADDLFEQLDLVCLETPDRCEDRNEDGSFADDELEGLYQNTLSKDRQARAVLVVSQVALASAVVFFILDLSNRPPENVPYDPPVTLALQPAPGGTLALGARVRLPLTRAPR